MVGLSCVPGYRGAMMGRCDRRRPEGPAAGELPRERPAARPATREPAAPRDPRQPPGAKTGRPHRIPAGNQAAQDRSGPPASQDHVLLAHQERCLSLRRHAIGGKERALSSTAAQPPRPQRHKGGVRQFCRWPGSGGPGRVCDRPSGGPRRRHPLRHIESGSYSPAGEGKLLTALTTRPGSLAASALATAASASALEPASEIRLATRSA